MPSDNTDELRLLELAIGGDRIAFDRLFALQSDWLIHHTGSLRLRNVRFTSHEPNDLLKEIAARGWKALPTFQLPQKTQERLPNFRRFLVRIDELWLLEQAIEGDHNAFDILFSIQRGWLLRRAQVLLRGNNELEACEPEDLVQETAFRTLKAIPTFKLPPKPEQQLPSFRQYLIIIMERYFIDLMRKANAGYLRVEAWLLGSRNEGPEQEAPAPIRTPSRVVGDAEAAAQIRKCLAALPARARNVVEMRYMQQMSYDEIAAAMGVTNEAINGVLRIARKQMRECMVRSSLWNTPGRG